MRDRHTTTARLLWGARHKPARGPKPTLDLDRIARAGIELADAEGLADLSMQRVAGQLGVTKMALYRYVPGKAELLALLVEVAIGPYPARPDQRAGWRAQLEYWARELLTVFQRHPWALDVTNGPRVMGPAELSWLEHAITALDGTGLSGTERMDAAALLTSHVRSITQQGRSTHPAEGSEAELGPILSELMHTHGERFPALAAVFASSAAQPEGQDLAWEFGLHRILDGLTVLIEQRQRT